MEKDKVTSFAYYMKNNIYALKLLGTCNKRRVFHIAFQQFLSYFDKLFYQVFFLRFVIKSIERNLDFEYIMKLMFACFLVFTFSALYSSYFKSYVVPKTDIIIYKKLYELLYTKARNVELGCYEDSEFFSRYTMALDGADRRIIDAVTTFFHIVFGIVASAVAFYVIITIDLFVGIFVIFPILGNFVFGKLMNRVYYGRYVDNIKNERVTQYVNRIMYLSDYAKEIRYSNVHDLMMKKFNDSVKNTACVMAKYGVWGTFYMWFKNVLSYPVVFEGVMLYAAYRTIVTGSMNLSDLAIIFSTMSTTSRMLIDLFNAITESMKNGLYVEYTKNFLEYKEKIPEDQDGLIPDEKIKSIEFRDVTFYYKDEMPLIQNLSFRVEEKKRVALVGHNGAGKTTIIKLLLRLYDPVEGTIFVNGIDIKKYNLKAYRKLFSVAFQDYKIFAMSVKENICMGNYVSDETSVIDKALQRVGMKERIERLPKKFDTNLTKEFDKDGEVMSGGEYQKLVVARAFAKDGNIKVFDEPSSALDPIAEHELYKNIIKEIGDDIMIFISHRLSSVKDADTVFVIEHGQIIERGTHKELMSLNGTYADLYRKQAKNYMAVEEV